MFIRVILHARVGWKWIRKTICPARACGTTKGRMRRRRGRNFAVSGLLLVKTNDLRTRRIRSYNSILTPRPCVIVLDFEWRTLYARKCEITGTVRSGMALMTKLDGTNERGNRPERLDILYRINIIIIHSNGRRTRCFMNRAENNGQQRYTLSKCLL